MKSRYDPPPPAHNLRRACPSAHLLTALSRRPRRLPSTRFAERFASWTNINGEIPDPSGSMHGPHRSVVLCTRTALLPDWISEQTRSTKRQTILYYMQITTLHRILPSASTSTSACTPPRSSPRSSCAPPHDAQVPACWWISWRVLTYPDCSFVFDIHASILLPNHLLIPVLRCIHTCLALPPFKLNPFKSSCQG